MITLNTMSPCDQPINSLLPIQDCMYTHGTSQYMSKDAKCCSTDPIPDLSPMTAVFLGIRQTLPQCWKCLSCSSDSPDYCLTHLDKRFGNYVCVRILQAVSSDAHTLIYSLASQYTKRSPDWKTLQGLYQTCS